MGPFAWIAAAAAQVSPPVYAPPPAPQLTAEQTTAIVERARASGGEAAVTPLAVQAPDPAFRGKLLLNRHPVDPPAIAQQKLLALGAVRAILGKSERVLPLSIIGPVAPGAGPPTDPARLAWCNGKEERGDAIRCYQDRDGDGRFETARWGETYADDSPYTLYMVAKPEPIAPIPYTRIDPAQLPDVWLTYQGCRVTDRIQYSARIRLEGDGDVKTFGCPNAAQPVGRSKLVGPGRYRVDRVVVDVAYATPEEAIATVVEPIPAGALLDRIDVGKPVRLLGERRGWPIEQAEMRQRYAAAPYQFVGAPVATAEGTQGTAILSGRYRYGYTARIVGYATHGTMFSGRKQAFADGDALYGIPMQSPLQRQLFGEPLMIWCAPKARKAGDWRANCLQQQGVSRGVYREIFGALWIEQFADAANDTDAIELVEGPADLPRATVRYIFHKWTKNRLILRRVVIEESSGAGPEMLAGQIDVPRMKEGAALLPIAGGVVRIDPTADLLGFRAAVIRPLDADASAQPGPGFLSQMIDDAKRDGRPLTLEEKADLIDADRSS